MDSPLRQSELFSPSPNVLSGTPVFAGTRVPVQTLFEYLEAGDTLDDFLHGSQQFNVNTLCACSKWH